MSVLTTLMDILKHVVRSVIGQIKLSCIVRFGPLTLTLSSGLFFIVGLPN